MATQLREPLLPKLAEPFKVSASPPKNVLLNPLAWLLWVLDFLIWLLTLIGPVKWLIACCKSRNRGVQVGEGWRHVDAKDGLVATPDPACSTVHDLMQKAFSKHASSRACGTRKYLGQHKPEWSKFPLQKFGETQWITYGEFGHRVRCFGAGLLTLGLKPPPPGTDLQAASGPHVLLIFEDTCASWITACLGAFTQSIAVATSYSTLGISSVAEAVNETGAKAVVCNIKDVDKIAKFCEGKCPSLDTIIYTTNYSTETTAKCSSSAYTVVAVEDVIVAGDKGTPAFAAPTAETLAVIMYTSGSTGKPKGVMITHKSLVASIGGLMQKFHEVGLQEGQETYLAYLPAAHILELAAELTNFALGSAVGFADPKTISSKGACRERPDGTLNTHPGYPYPPGAIQEFQPTLMAAVPKIWDILKKGVEEVVGKGSPLKKLLFQVAYSGRFWALCQGRESPLFKKVVFQKLSDMLGGRLKAGITGGGPISSDVQNFIRTSFAIPLLQGYALTETACAGTVQSIDDIRCGVVGPPLTCVEIKLRSCLNEQGEPEIMDREMKPYMSTDRKHYDKPCMGRGEILIRGPSVSSGYFKQPEKTAEVFDAEGWFRSGDVGLMTPDGAVMIVDRVKNLVKLKGGEYIAIEAMEKEYGTSVYANAMNGGILCYGDGDMDRPVALLQANTAELEKWAKDANVEYSSVEELCRLPAAEKLVLDSLVAIGKASGLGSNEILCAVALIPGSGPHTGALTPESPWTPENGGLTASNKLNRQPIQMGCAKPLQHLRALASR